MIPLEERGYAIDRTSGVVHRRYAGHATALPRTSYRGVMATMVDPQPCPECWPPQPEQPGYYCPRCERRHIIGSAVYERHLVADEVDARLEDVSYLSEGGSATVTIAPAPEPEPYYPRPYPEE